jgi:hypothetical protein
MRRNHMSRSALLAAVLLLPGCAAVKSHWPFGKAADTAPTAVTELDVRTPEGMPPPAVLQYWQRNTLILDLQNVAAAGKVMLARQEGKQWPARIAVRMAPQRFEVVEVRGAQRLVLPVASAGEGAVTAELPPGIYDQATAQLTLSWGARSDF